MRKIQTLLDGYELVLLVSYLMVGMIDLTLNQLNLCKMCQVVFLEFPLIGHFLNILMDLLDIIVYRLNFLHCREL